MTPHDIIHLGLPIATGFLGFWFATVLNRLGRDAGADQVGLGDAIKAERDLFGSRGQGGKPHA